MNVRRRGLRETRRPVEMSGSCEPVNAMTVAVWGA